MKSFDEIMNDIENKHPYKQGNRSPHLEYNDGWQDACDCVRRYVTDLLEQQQKEIEQLKARQKDIKSAKWLTWEEKFPDAKPPRENGLGVFCTACGLHSDNMYSFCPNCGSKMKEEK